MVRNMLQVARANFKQATKAMPRQEIIGTPLGRSIRGAVEKSERRIKNAAGQLAELEIVESEIRALVEARIAMRLSTGEKLA